MHEDYHALALLTSLLYGFNYFSYTNQSQAKRKDGIRLFSILVFDGESFQLRGKDEKVATIGFAGYKLTVVHWTGTFPRLLVFLLGYQYLIPSHVLHVKTFAVR